MGGKLTKDGVILPGNEGVTQTKSILSVDGKEADEAGNIDLGGAFDFVDKKTQVKGCKALTWNTLRVQGLDDWEKYRDSELEMAEESLTVSTLTGEYVYIAEIDAENKSSAYYRSDNGGATYSRHIIPTEGVDVKLIRTSDTGKVVLLSTHIGGVLISEDYGKTWEIPTNLNESTSNSESSWFISMSSNGKNLVYPNTDGKLYLENRETGEFDYLFSNGPYGMESNSIKEFFVSNHTNRNDMNMVILTRSGEVHTSRDGGYNWSNQASDVIGLSTDKEVTKIYIIKDNRTTTLHRDANGNEKYLMNAIPTVYYMHIDGDGFSTVMDFSSNSKFEDLTRNPEEIYLKSIFVSEDYETGETKIAVFAVYNIYASWNKAYPSKTEHIQEGEDVFSARYVEKLFQGVLISEDSGTTWDLSQIKYTAGYSDPFFAWPDSMNTVGDCRLQLMENFESGLLVYTNATSSRSRVLNNIIRISDKSTSYSSSSKMILDGGITLGVSMESDVEFYNKIAGTIDYHPYFDGFTFHFDQCSLNLKLYESASPLDGRPLAVTDIFGFTGKKGVNVEFADTLKNMTRLESVNVALRNPRIERGELLVKGGNGFFPDLESLIDEGHTEAEALQILSIYETRGDDIVSSGIKASDISGLKERIEALENIHVDVEVAIATQQQVAAIPLSSSTNFSGMVGQEDGFYVGSNYAIFYYAGAYTIKFHTMSQTGKVPIKITYLSGGGGGAGGYQGQGGNGDGRVSTHEAIGGIQNGFNGSDGGYSQVQYLSHEGSGWDYLKNQGNSRPPIRYYRRMGTSITSSTLYGWTHSVTQGTAATAVSGVWPSQPPYNQYYNVYRPKQLPTVITGESMANGVEYMVYVGSGGNGGSGAGDNRDWDWYGGSKGSGGAGGTRGAGSNGGKGGGNGVASGGNGGIAGGKSGATFTNGDGVTSDIDITTTQEYKSLVGFGQVGANGATGGTGNWHHSAKDTGGGGGGGGGSNGIVLIEWGEGI